MSIRKSMLVSLATAGMAIATPVAGAQGTQAVGLSANGFMQSIFVSILGGWAPSGSQLYFFPDPFDPATGAFSPNSKIAIGPKVVRNGNSPFVAGANSTSLGTFNPGTQLVFGVLLPNNTWRYTGTVATEGALMMRNTVSARWTQGQVGVAGASSQKYGWDLNNYNTPEGNDLIFSVDAVSGATVTPEPASMTLIGLGLAGVGLVRRRRKNKA